MYDNVLGRWGTQDPLAEKYYGYSPYNFCLNNPILFVDSDGRKVNLSQLTDKNHQIALRNFMRTSEGRRFIGRYMAEGESLTVQGKTYTFDKTGDRAKDVLWMNSIDFEDKNTLGKNRTMVKNSRREIKEVISSDNISQNGVYQVIDLQRGMDTRRATMTLGHEAFVHADESANLLTNIENGNLNGAKSLINALSDIGDKAVTDHQRLGNGKISSYRNYADELTRLLKDLFYTRL